MSRLRSRPPARRSGVRPRWLLLGFALISVGIFVLRSSQEATSPRPVSFVSLPLAMESALTASGSELQAAETPSVDYSSIPLELLAGSKTSPSEGTQEKTAPRKSKTYVVQPGDSLWSIAKAFNTDMATLVEANALKKNRFLRVGQTLRIPPGSGIYYRVRAGESLWKICRRYRINLQNVLSHNQIHQANLIQVGQQLFLPGASAKRAVTDLIWPVRGRLTSRFGMRQHPMGGGFKMHNGVDISAPTGRLVRAAQGGKVIFAGSRGALGRTVVLQHEEQYQTVYGHNSKILVKVGQIVQQGQAIARVGTTGLSTGPHVHFEVRKSGRAIDPLRFLP